MKLPFSGFEWTRTRLVSVSCLSLLLGLWLAKLGWATNWQLLAASVFPLVLFFKKSRLVFIALFILFLNLGLMRGQSAVASYKPLLEKLDQKVKIIGVVQDDAGITDRRQTEFHLTNLHIVSGEQKQQSGGRIRVRGFPDNKVNRGDQVETEGTLRPALGNRQAQISYAQISVLNRNINYVEKVRRNFIAGVYSSMAEPGASLGLGLLIGTRSLLPNDLESALAITGLTHIVAVSGYNLTIIVRFSRRIFVKHSKYLATVIPVVIIIFFLLVTGFSPSIMRAAIVSGLSLAAWYYGRPLKPSVIILLAAASTAVINPAYLWYDIGWYLSFLAFFGVLVISPTLMARIYKTKRPPALVQMFSESLAAQLMTLPLIMFIFGRVSLIGFIANAIVLPLVPLAMLLVFVAGVAGILIPNLAGWLSWPANLLLGMIINAITKLAGIPWAAKEVSLASWQLVSLYSIIGFGVVIMRHKAKKYLKSLYSVVE